MNNRTQQILRRIAKRVGTAIVLAALVPGPMRAQASNGSLPSPHVRQVYESHDKAAQAARAAGDWATVRRHAAAVDTLFNGNPFTIMALARASARLGDKAAAVDLVRTVAAMGIMRNLENEKDLESLHTLPEWAGIVAKNSSNAAVIGAPRVLFALPAIEFLAEDIVWDATGDRYLVSSVRTGAIVAVNRNGLSSPYSTREKSGLWGAFGLAVDSARSRLWVTTAAMPQVSGLLPADSGKAAIVRLNLRTAAVEKRFPITPNARGIAPGDVTLSPVGDLYVSDSRSGVVYVIRVGVDTLEVLIPEGTFMSPQGQVLAPDGRSLFVADYVRGVARVDLASRSIHWVRHARDVALNGIDGLTAGGPRTLIAVQNGVMPNRLMELTLDAQGDAITGTRVLAQDTAVIREPTHGVVIGGELHFIANSGWDGFGDDGALLKDGRLTPPTILSVRLRR